MSLRYYPAALSWLMCKKLYIQITYPNNQFCTLQNRSSCQQLAPVTKENMSGFAPTNFFISCPIVNIQIALPITGK